MRYFRVRNFERFQHYKSGRHSTRPLWIKLYASILVDYELGELPDAARGHLFLIWILASQLDNHIPWDAKWIGQRIAAQGRVDLDLLEKTGFIESLDTLSRQSLDSPSSLLSSSLSEENKNLGSDSLNPEDLREGWNDICASAGLATVKELSQTRRKRVGLRLKEHPEVDFWQQVMNNVRGSPFLLGHNDRSWKCSFDWLFENDTNALKVAEGRYAAEKTSGSNGRY